MFFSYSRISISGIFFTGFWSMRDTVFCLFNRTIQITMIKRDFALSGTVLR
jgi:hypothetical protein